MRTLTPRLSALALATLLVPPAFAQQGGGGTGNGGDDGSGRLCDFTTPYETQGLTCPPGEQCYDAWYAEDTNPPIDGGYCWTDPQGAPPQYNDLGYRDWVIVRYVSHQPPTSRLTCVQVDTCHIECEAMPVGDGISHDWTVTQWLTDFTADGAPTAEPNGNTLSICTRPIRSLSRPP